MTPGVLWLVGPGTGIDHAEVRLHASDAAALRQRIEGTGRGVITPAGAEGLFNPPDVQQWTRDL